MIPRLLRAARASVSPAVRSALVLAASLALAFPAAEAAELYSLPIESTVRKAGVPQGKVHSFALSNSVVFRDAARDGWVYIPAQYDAAKPAALMVFMDGHAYVDEKGQQRVPIVFDNLIAAGEMPVTVGVFLNPGHVGGDAPPPGGWGNRSNRSYEYDSLGGQYVKFLLEEALPYVTKTYGLNLSTDPSQRALCGMSSGGICAFTAAWERPDQFGRVLSQISSFVNIRGGHVYPALIRKTERKPIRVFLQDGRNDLNNLHGDWPLANQTMASALAFAGYDFKFVFGDGSHSGQHGGAILPDTLRWLWRPSSMAPAPSTNNWRGDEALNKVLPGGGQPGDWQLVGEGYGFTDGATSDAQGNFWFSDLNHSDIWRVPPDGQPEKWLANGPKLSGLKWGADGKLYAASQGGPGDVKQRIVVIDPATKEVETVANNVKPNDLVVTKNGRIYFTDTGAGQVVMVPTSARNLGGPRPVAGGITAPNGIALSADQKQLIVSEYKGTNVWTFLIGEEGALFGGERYMTLVVPPGKTESAGDGSTMDADGRAYVTSTAGIQMFDWTGRLGGVIAKPRPNTTPVSCAFAGPGRQYLFVCDQDKVWRRKTLASGTP